MFRIVSAFVIAALLTAFAVNRSANGDDSLVISRSTTRTVTTTDPAPNVRSLDDYAGVYRTPDGATFVVIHDGDSLTIELPDIIALPIRAAGESFVVDSSVVSISFEAEGGKARMVLAQPLGQPVVATRVSLPRGVVTIHDI
jgi:hypothetical protein